MKEFNSRKVYDHLSARYEKYCRSYWCRFGVRLVELTAPDTGQRVLDVACGTGSSALPAASKVGPTGTVVAIDTSQGMLEIARDKAASAALHNIEFTRRDMRDLDFPPDHFEHVICAFGVFFVANMTNLFAKLWSYVAPGGRLAIAVWGKDFLQPMHGYWKRTMQAHLPGESICLPWERIHEENIARFMEEAGVCDVNVVTERSTLQLRSPEHWWDMVESTGLSRFLGRLDNQALQDVKKENLEHVRGGCITELSIPVVYALSTKPLTRRERHHERTRQIH